MAVWQAGHTKGRFDELLRVCLKDGPQIVAQDGVEVAVLVSIEEWNRLGKMAQSNLKSLLLAPAPRAKLTIPKRGTLRARKIAAFE